MAVFRDGSCKQFQLQPLVFVLFRTRNMGQIKTGGTKKMDYINAIPAILGSVGGFLVALALSVLIKKIGAFIDRIQS